MTLLDQTITQLDTLVIFLNLEHDEIFETLSSNASLWLPEPSAPFLPGDVQHYRVQVCHAAFLLGYSYVEAFLADLARKVYVRHPRKLSPDKQVTYKNLIDLGTDGDVFSLMIEREIRSVFAGTMTQILEHLERRLDLPTTSDQKAQLRVGSLIRNCLLHNGAIADRALAATGEYQLDAPIRLDSSRVHGFGRAAREAVRALWDAAAEKGFIAAE